jgi:hypothetical protein
MALIVIEKNGKINREYYSFFPNPCPPIPPCPLSGKSGIMVLWNVQEG